jgi:hypothetical protein
MSDTDVLALLNDWRAAERSLDAMAADDGGRAAAVERLNAAQIAYSRAFQRVAAQRANQWDVQMHGGDLVEDLG